MDQVSRGNQQRQRCTAQSSFMSSTPFIAGQFSMMMRCNATAEIMVKQNIMVVVARGAGGGAAAEEEVCEKMMKVRCSF